MYSYIGTHTTNNSKAHNTQSTTLYLKHITQIQLTQYNTLNYTTT